MPTVYVQGQKIYYEVMGSGEPLLLMHGWMQVGRDLVGVANALGGHYRVYLPDLPGYGQSVPPYRTFSNDFYQRDAALMVEFLTAVGVTTAHIMGFSDGGEVALCLAVSKPEICLSVIAWGAIGALDEHLAAYVRTNTLPMQVGNDIRTKHPGQEVDQWPAQWVDAFCAMIDTGGDISLSRAGAITAPLLLMLGDKDGLNPVADGWRFIEAAVNAPIRRLEVVEGIGHAIHLEDPKRFISTIDNFMRQT